MPKQYKPAFEIPSVLPVFDLQRHAEPADTAGTAAEAEMIEYTVNGEKMKLPAKIGDVDTRHILDKVASVTRKYETDRITAKYKPLEEAISKKDTELGEVRAALQKIEEANLSVEERVKKEYERSAQKIQGELKTEKEKAERNWNLFQEKAIITDIHASLSGFELFNQSQTVFLIMQHGKPKLVEKDGSFETVMEMVVNGERTEMAPKDFAKAFLALPENLNQIKTSIKPGGGTSANGAMRGQDGSLIYKRSEMTRSEETRRDYLKRMKSGESVSIDERA